MAGKSKPYTEKRLAGKPDVAAFHCYCLWLGGQSPNTSNPKNMLIGKPSQHVMLVGTNPTKKPLVGKP